VTVHLAPLVAAAEALLGKLPQFYKGYTIGRRNVKIEAKVRGPVLENDFSKYDRTIGAPCRRLEREIMKNLCREDDYKIFTSCMDSIENAVILHVGGIGLSGVSQRWSGEPGTSIWNGTWNCFCAWLAKQPHDAFFDDTEIDVSVEGDDGLLVGFEPKEYQEAADFLGLDAKLIPRPSLLHAMFLGRVHAYDANGTFRSMADLPRSLRKWHITAKTADPRVTPRELLAGKSLAYMAIDYHSPLLGAVAWAFMQRTRNESVVLNKHTWRRAELADLSNEDLREKPAPEFDPILAAHYTYWFGISVAQLHHHHKQFIDFGNYGPVPDVIVFPPNEGAERYLET